MRLSFSRKLSPLMLTMVEWLPDTLIAAPQKRDRERDAWFGSLAGKCNLQKMVQDKRRFPTLRDFLRRVGNTY